MEMESISTSSSSNNNQEETMMMVMAGETERESGSGEKRSFDVSMIQALLPENRSLPHKKRRPAPINELVLMESKTRLKSLTEERGTPKGTTPTATFTHSKAMKKKTESAWMHRLYPFDGPSIEEFTPLFDNIDISVLVENKLANMKDKWLSKVVKGYYEEVITMDHVQYKNAARPPHGTPEDIRPFLLSRHQLKSFNSDYLRSALRKTKVNKSFCLLLRGSSVKGVPEELRTLGNEAFARSIRTHQIIAFFTRYHSLYQTKYPGKVLDLTEKEHKILLDCLKDIMRRVTAKKVIQQSVVGSLFVNDQQQRQQQPHSAVVEVGTGNFNQAEDDTLSHGETSNEDTVETPTMMPDTDEKENKSDYPMLDQSFDSNTSTSSPGSSTLFPSSSSSATPLAVPPNALTTPRGHDSIIAYSNILSLLSDDARQAVEAMVDNLKRKVMDDARHQVCKRSYEEGRRVGRIEGRIVGFEEGVKTSVLTPPRHQSSSARA